MKSKKLPFLPLRSVSNILLPYNMLSIKVERDLSIQIIKDANENYNKKILITYQKDKKIDNQKIADIWSTCIEAEIVTIKEISKNKIMVDLFGIKRAYIKNIEKDTMIAEYINLKDLINKKEETKDFIEFILLLQKKLLKLNNIKFNKLPKPKTISQISNFVDTLIFHTPISKSEKLSYISITNIVSRANKLYEDIDKLLKNNKSNNDDDLNLNIKIDPNIKVFDFVPKFNNSKSSASNDSSNDIEKLKTLIDNTALSSDAKESAEKELNRIIHMQPSSLDYSVGTNYIETVCSLPWGVFTKDILDIKKAKKVLEDGHYGLEKPKENILEFLAVKKLYPEKKGQILCFSGPPGVGKTSLGKGIANAMGRKFIRMSVGSLHDESEIRGHRRTYVGSMPGKIIEHIRKCGSNNPVFMLDEVDKMGIGFRGDPSAALLEVLDPEQNNSFVDNYLGFGFDLSNVLFIITVNDIKPVNYALRDRMDIIEISGYSIYDKLKIAEKFLIPKQKKENGLEDVDVLFSKESINTIIEDFTFEAGVRSLERKISNIFRKIAIKVVTSDEKISTVILPDDVLTFLGPKKSIQDKMLKQPTLGVATGLAWTPSGGQILFIEATQRIGKERIEITGNLGDVMKESVRLACSWARSKFPQLNDLDIHVHFPAGAIPKDGPSAGIAIVIAIISAVKNIPVRNDIAATGEISLRGKVLPVGGIKEKILGAHRAGIRNVAIPKENEKDLYDIPKEVLNNMEIHLLSDMTDAIDFLLHKESKQLRESL